MNNKLTIVMYHYVRDLQNTRFPEIKGLDYRLFEKQIKYLKKNYTIISMDEVLNSLKNKVKLPSRAALLTFDDGYKDHYTYAFPIMMKHNVKGAFYIPLKSFKEKKILDVNKIHFILASELDKNKIIEDIYMIMNELRKKYKLKTNAFYYKKLAIKSRFDTKDVIFIKRLLQVELEEKVRNIIVQKLFIKYIGIDEKAFWEELYMSKEQINVMKNSGMHIGSHSFDHYWLDSLTKEKQEEQIKLSLGTLNEIGVDTNSWTMCYPYGGYNESTLEILEKYGCKLALTTKVEIAELNQENKFELPRLDTNDIPKSENAEVNEFYFKG